MEICLFISAPMRSVETLSGFSSQGPALVQRSKAKQVKRQQIPPPAMTQGDTLFPQTRGKSLRSGEQEIIWQLIPCSRYTHSKVKPLHSKKTAYTPRHNSNCLSLKTLQWKAIGARQVAMNPLTGQCVRALQVRDFLGRIARLGWFLRELALLMMVCSWCTSARLGAQTAECDGLVSGVATLFRYRTLIFLDVDVFQCFQLHVFARESDFFSFTSVWRRWRLKSVHECLTTHPSKWTRSNMDGTPSVSPILHHCCLTMQRRMIFRVV